MAYATGDADARWPDGVIPYVISGEFSEGQRREVLRAIDHWNDRTIIRLRRRFNEADFVRFVGRRPLTTDGTAPTTAGP